MKILAIEVRGLPASFLGCYGNEWVGTPCLDRLAAEGIVFDQHIAHAPDLRDETPSFRRGFAGDIALPAAAAKVTYKRLSQLRDFAKAALTAWRGAGSGILWIDGPDLAPPWRLDLDILSSYCEEDEETPAEPWPDPPHGVFPQFSVDDFIRLQNTFAAVVTYFDAQLERLLESLRDQEMVVCLTARGGLPLGEHGLVGPVRAWLHEETVHVPLLLRLPGGQDAGLRLGALTQPLDLLPTFLDLLGQPLPQSAGHSLGPLLRREVSSVRPYACAALTVGASQETMLRTADWAFLSPRRVPDGDPPRLPQLFAKPDDRWEVNDVRQAHLELVEELEATLNAACGLARP
jgi:arylsulfatase A-like enzyme